MSDAPWTDARARAALHALFGAALAAADPARVLGPCLPAPPARGHVVVVGAGKAAGSMAAAVEAAWPDVPLAGVVVTAHGHGAPTRRIRVREAGHPVPDAAGESAAREILAAVGGLSADDLVLALISGGGSALLALPAPGLTLADKQVVGARLLASGATITEMNAVRRQLSAIKGGRLAQAAAPARVVTLAISDVPGDDPATIASGPTVPNADPPARARAILDRYGIAVPEAVARHLARPPEPMPAAGVDYRLIATPIEALRAAAEAAAGLGLAPLILGDGIEGEARHVGTALAGIAASAAAHGHPARPPCVILSGGETTVTIGPGADPGARGGRNTTLALAFAIGARGVGGIWAITADTDGIDGAAGAAGAIVTPDTIARARAAGHDPLARLLAQDSGGLFAAIGDLVQTGPTRTNVNDFRAVLIAG